MYPTFYNDSPNDLGFHPTYPPHIFYPLYYKPTPLTDLSPQRSPPQKYQKIIIHSNSIIFNSTRKRGT